MRTSLRVAAALLVALWTAPARGFIEKVLHLQEVIDQSSYIQVGRVEKVDPLRQTVQLTMTSALKGKLDFPTVRINLAAAPAGHPQYLLERLKPGAEAIMFFQIDDRSIGCCVHAGNTWFQLFATDEPQKRDAIWWRMSHVEVYLRRTYDGNTPDLIRIIGDAVAGRAKPPAPNPKAPKIEVQAPATAGPAPAAPPATGPVPPGGFHQQLSFPVAADPEPRGLAWADVNGDERLDLLAARSTGVLLLVNQGHTFQNLTRQFGLQGQGARSVSWADYNGDDHPDLMTDRFALFTSVGGTLRNDSRLVPAPASRNTEGAAWCDANGDGWPDLLITNGEGGIRLLQNTGAGPAWFRDVSEAAGLGPKGPGAGNGDFIAGLDADADGYGDLLYNLGDGLLLRNTGRGGFVVRSGTGLTLPGGNNYKRGLAVADFDNDDDPDLFVPAADRPKLYRHNADGTFTDVFAQCGDPTAETDPCVAAAWGDVDGDGNLDLFVCHTQGSSRLYLGDGKGRFRDVSEAAGVRKLSPAYAASLADVDADGDLDLAVHLSDRVVIALNDFRRPTKYSALTVQVHVRRGLVGAVVRVDQASGRSCGTRLLAMADSCGGQTSPNAHFGLAAGKYHVTVCLSDGRAHRKSIDLTVKPATLVFHENEFQ